jgi:uncharacterized protein
MGRMIVLVLLVLVAVWAIRRALARHAKADTPPPRADKAAVGELVRCAHCGVHLPRGEAREAGGLPYCGEEHARLGPGGGK